MIPLMGEADLYIYLVKLTAKLLGEVIYLNLVDEAVCKYVGEAVC